MTRSIFSQHFEGIFVLFAPLIGISLANPYFFVDWNMRLLTSLCFVVRLLYLMHSSTKKPLTKNVFIPSERQQLIFDEQISCCGMDPKTIIIHYAFAQGSVALAHHRTIVVDPSFWNFQEPEASAAAARCSIQEEFFSQLMEFQKKQIEQVIPFITPAAQSFIFKHELGRIARKFSYKTMFVSSLQLFLNLFGSISLGVWLYTSRHWHGALVIGLCIIIMSLMDVLSGLISNATFKLYEEKQADLFAARFSTKEELLAAAHLFLKIQTVADEYSKNYGLFRCIPQSIQTGYPNGVVRAKYLRAYAHQKVE